jgi:hypothetical protein
MNAVGWSRRGITFSLYVTICRSFGPEFLLNPEEYG